MKETEREHRKTSCDSRPQRTGLWPRRKRVVAERDRGLFHRDNGDGATSQETRQIGRESRREESRRNKQETGGAHAAYKSRLQASRRGCPYIRVSQRVYAVHQRRSFHRPLCCYIRIGCVDICINTDSMTRTATTVLRAGIEHNAEHLISHVYT